MVSDSAPTVGLSSVEALDLGHVVNEVDDTLAVAPLVVIP